jgi:hypothetical protein
MAIDWRHLLAGAAVIFLAFLLVKMRPALGKAAASSGSLRAIKERARAAATPREKAEALCEAGTIAARQPWRFSAANYFMRAMRADPAWSGAIERATLALQKRRPKVLERILWQQLANIPWDDAHRAAVLAAVESLRELYQQSRVRDRGRAEFLARFSKLVS